MIDRAAMNCDNSNDLKVIWLQPRCCAHGGEDRLWCEDPQDPCDNCGAQWIKFVLPTMTDRAAIIETSELAMYWRGRAQALRMVSHENEEIAETFEECAGELTRALAAVPAPPSIPEREKVLEALRRALAYVEFSIDETDREECAEAKHDKSLIDIAIAALERK